MSWLTDKLTRLMQERDQSVETVARHLGIERSRLSNILAGSAIPNENLTKRLARYFGEEPGQWLDNVNKPQDATPGATLPVEFLKVAKVAEVPDGDMQVVFNGLVVVANVGGRFHAFGNVCPHAAGPIGEGFLDGCVVECPWHAGRWDITTGKALTALATADIPLFDVRVSDEDVEIRLNQTVLTQGIVARGGPDLS